MYIWGEEQELAFVTLKQKLTSEPVLALPTDEGDFVLDTDASLVAIAGILQQWQMIDGKPKLRGLRQAERNYGAPKLEMLGAITFIEAYHNFLTSMKFTLRCDNQALAWLKRYRVTCPMVARWIQRLGLYYFDFQHRERRFHTNADGLSKKTEYMVRGEQYKEPTSGFNFVSQEVFDNLPDLDEKKKDKDEKIEEKKELPREITRSNQI